jgi:hypothetical protein
LKPIRLVEQHKRWGELYFCSKAHLHDYFKKRQQEEQVASFFEWLSQPNTVRAPRQ